MHKQKDLYFPKMLALVLIFLSILLFLPNIIFLRIVKIGNFSESLAIFFFPLVYSIADSITEVYGKDKAIFILSSCYLISLFFSILLMLSSYLPFPSNLENQEAYNVLFKKGPYIIVVGLISVGFSMIVNITIMSKLKMIYRNQHFIIRCFASSSIGELIVTGMAYPLIFWKMDVSIIQLMINAYLFKVLYSFVGAYPAKILVFLMRKIDGIEANGFNNDIKSICSSGLTV